MSASAKGKFNTVWIDLLTDFKNVDVKLYNLCFHTDPPGPISTEPLLTNSGKTHISLQWGKPDRLDNSAPVIAYRVDAWEMGQDGGAVWREIGMSPINLFDAFNLKPDCQYHFKVTAKNRYGWGPSVQTTSPISIGGSEVLPEFVKILPGQMKALSGSECVLECSVRGQPRPKIIWYKDGHRVVADERIEIRQIAFTCRLLINQVFEVDNGRYSCEAVNSKGRVTTFARLQVVNDPKLYAADFKIKELIRTESEIEEDTLPIFVMRMRDRRVQVSYPVRLTCQVKGYPKPNITWTKNGLPVFNDRKHIIYDDGYYNTLEISKTSLDDCGTYSAIAKNELGSVSCNCSLIVDKGIGAYIIPEFTTPLDPEYTFKEGEEIRISAKVEAYPSVGVAWHRNGIKLRPSRRILATLDHNGYVELIIANANEKDHGVYTCVASNAVGRTETCCNIFIKGSGKDSPVVAVPSIRNEHLP